MNPCQQDYSLPGVATLNPRPHACGTAGAAAAAAARGAGRQPRLHPGRLPAHAAPGGRCCWPAAALGRAGVATPPRPPNLSNLVSPHPHAHTVATRPAMRRPSSSWASPGSRLRSTCRSGRRCWWRSAWVSAVCPWGWRKTCVGAEVFHSSPCLGRRGGVCRRAPTEGQTKRSSAHTVRHELQGGRLRRCSACLLSMPQDWVARCEVLLPHLPCP